LTPARPKPYTEAVGDLVRYIASPEGKACWGERHPVILEGVQALYDLLLNYDPERYR